jgi:hypothetical protein
MKCRKSNFLSSKYSFCQMLDSAAQESRTTRLSYAPDGSSITTTTTQ